MNETWALILVLAVATFALKVSGPLMIGHRELPRWAIPVISVLPGAMLTALIVVQTVGGEGRIVLDERLAGLTAAGIVLWWRRSALIVAVIAATATTALARALI